MSDGLSLGTVKGTVELEDKMSSAVDLLGRKIEELDGKFGGFGQRIAEQATSFFSAEAALDAVREAARLTVDTLNELTIEGSHAADIEDIYGHLTETAGMLGDTLLTKTRDGLRGTVTDMDIMTRINQNLAVGLKLTDDQMSTLAQGAVTLAKATGGTTAEAMDKLSDAMVTGRTRGIAMLTGKIDLAAAEDAYAEKLGTTTDHLTEQGKQAAIQAVILEKVAAASDRIGDTQIRLADKIQQVKVEFENFEEELGTAVATSPVIAAGFDGIRTALEGAFGDDQAKNIHTMAVYIDNFAIGMIDAAEAGVNAAAILGQEWNATKVVFGDLEQIIDGDILVFKYLAEGVAEVGAALHLPGAADDVKRIDTEIQNLMVSMAARGKALQEDKAAEIDWATGSGKVIEVLEGIKGKMVDAQKTEGEFTDVIRDNAKAHDGASASAEKHGQTEAHVGEVMAMTKEELKKYNEAWMQLNSVGSSWEETLQSIQPDQLKVIQYYLDAGAAVDTLASAFPNLTKSQIEAVKALEQNAKAEADAADTLTKLYADYYSKKTALYGTDAQKAAAAADKDYEIRVAELQKKGVKDVEYYNELWDLRNKDVKLADETRLLQDTKSKASLDKKISDAKDYLDFMRSNYDQYTDADREAQAKVVADLENQRSHWNALGGTMNALGANGTKVFSTLDEALMAFEDGLDDAKIKVKGLDGEMESLAQAKAKLDQGTSEDVTSANFGQKLKDFLTAGGWNPAMQGVQQYRDPVSLAKAGYSFAEVIKYGFDKNNQGPLPPPAGPRIPGFSDGGIGDFGTGTLAMLHGREAIIPLDGNESKIGGNTINVTIPVNGTASDVARRVADELIAELRRQHLVG